MCGTGERDPTVSYLGLLVALAVALFIFALLYAAGKGIDSRALARLAPMRKREENARIISHLLTWASGVNVDAFTYRGFAPRLEPLNIRFSDLGLVVGNRDQEKTILTGVSGTFTSGKLIAIMGPSGAGKSTFLNVLCGKAYYGKTTGKVAINGEETDLSSMRSSFGFVPQDDIVFPDLTVEENIRFQAALCLPSHIDAATRDHYVQDTLHMMHLSSVANSLVGDVTKRGISGGQRKRVNIALEIVSDPVIAFLDEPTSGLDATAATEIVKGLRELTAIGRTIITVIHQPRYSIFEMFDTVLLLGPTGRTVYVGPAKLAKAYFESLGFVFPDNENAADVLLDIIAGKVHLASNPVFVPSDLFAMWDSRGAQFLADHGVEEEPSGASSYTYATATSSSLASFSDSSSFCSSSSSRSAATLHSGKGGEAEEEEEEESSLSDGSSSSLSDGSSSSSSDGPSLSSDGSSSSSDGSSSLSDASSSSFTSAFTYDPPSSMSDVDIGRLKKLAAEHGLEANDSLRTLVAHFDHCDRNGSGSLTRDDLVRMLQHVAPPHRHEGKATHSVADWLVLVLREADADHDGEVTLFEFLDFYAHALRFTEDAQPREVDSEGSGSKGVFGLWLFGLWVFLQRTLIQFVRHPEFVAMDITLSVFSSFAIGFVNTPKFTLVRTVPMYLMLVIATTLMGAISGVRTFAFEKVNFWRESSAGINSLAYFAAHDLVTLLDVAVRPVFLVAPFYALVAPNSDFWSLYLVFGALTYMSYGLGFLIAHMFAVRNAVVVAVVIPFVLGGAFAGGAPSLADLSSNISPSMLGVAASSPSRWGLEAAVVSEINDLPSHFPLGDYLAQTGYNRDNYWLSNVVLGVMGIAARIAAYLVMVFTNRGKQV